MRIGKKRAKFTIRIYDNRNKKTKSIVFDSEINSVEELEKLIIKLLEEYYGKLE